MFLPIIILLQINSSWGSPLPLNEIKRVHRIVNGFPALEGEFPFMALIYHFETPDLARKCGGAIISSNWILTAAHCLQGDKRRDYYVVAGITDIDEIQRKNVRRIESILCYDDVYYKHDIGLIQLEEKLTISRKIHIVRLPLPGYKVPAYTTAVMMGWGLISNYDSRSSNYLNKLEVNILPYELCYEEDLFEMETDKNFLSNYLCSFDRSSGPCSGDSGGPLITEKNLLIGIISSGPEICGSSSTTILYSNVARYRLWIKENTGI